MGVPGATAMPLGALVTIFTRTGACGAVGLAAMQLGALMGHKASWDPTGSTEKVSKTQWDPSGATCVIPLCMIMYRILMNLVDFWNVCCCMLKKPQYRDSLRFWAFQQSAASWYAVLVGEPWIAGWWPCLALFTCHLSNARNLSLSANYDWDSDTLSHLRMFCWHLLYNI